MELTRWREYNLGIKRDDFWIVGMFLLMMIFLATQAIQVEGQRNPKLNQSHGEVDFGRFSVGLQVDTGRGMQRVVNDLWTNSFSHDRYKFGWKKVFVVPPYASNKSVLTKYVIQSRDLVTFGGESVFVDDKYISFSDVCKKQYTSVCPGGLHFNLTPKGCFEQVYFDPQCSFEQKRINRVDLTFYSLYNSISQLLDIDPVFGITNDEVTFLDDFWNDTDGQVFDVQYGQSGWLNTGSGCVYNEDNYMICGGGEDGESGEPFANHGNPVTLKYTCNMTSAREKGCFGRTYNDTLSSDLCAVFIEDYKFRYIEAGVVKNFTKIAASNLSEYTFFASYNNTAGNCTYQVSQNFNVSNLENIPIVGHASNTDFGGVENVEIKNVGATTNSTFDYVYVYNGSITEDPINIPFSFDWNITDPILNRYFGELDPVLLNGTVTHAGNPAAPIIANITYRVTKNDTVVSVCNDCSDFNVNLTGMPQGRTEMNITLFANNTYHSETREFFRGVVLEACNMTPVQFPSINFSIKDEQTSELVSSSVEYVVTGSFNDNSVSDTFGNDINSTGALVSSFSVCTFADVTNRTMAADFQIKVGASGYETRIIDLLNLSLFNVTQFRDLFLIRNSVANTVTIHVTDQNDNVIPNVLVEANLFKVGNNSFSLVESKKTDFEGQAVMNLKTDDELYQFVLKQKGKVIHTSEVFEITTTDLFFRVILQSSGTGEILNVNNFARTLIRDNGTRNFNATWDDAQTSLLGAICLQVQQLGIYNQTVVFNTCSETTSGEFNYTIASGSEGNFLAKLTLILDDGRTYLLETSSLDYRQTADLFGLDGLMWVVFLVIFLAMIGLGSGFEVNNSIIFVLTGLMLFAVMNMFKVGLSAIIAIAVVGGVVLYYINKK
jgi:hypothetical protein